MGFLIALALQAALPAMTVPQVSVDLCGEKTHLQPDVTGVAPGELRVDYRRPAQVVLATLDDGTDGVVPMTLPGLSYDQTFALKNERTGEIVEFKDVVERRTPVVVADAPRDGTASARAQYGIGVPRTPAEARFGVCSGR
jgi:hypothetical protein